MFKRLMFAVLIILAVTSVASAQQAVRLVIDDNGTKADASTHAFPVQETTMVASTTSTAITTAVTTVPLVVGAKEITIFINNTSQQLWMKMGGATPAVGDGVLVQGYVYIDKLNPNEIIKITASESVPVVWIQR